MQLRGEGAVGWVGGLHARERADQMGLVFREVGLPFGCWTVGCAVGPGLWVGVGLQKDQNWTQIGPKLGPIKRLIIIKNTNNKNDK